MQIHELPELPTGYIWYGIPYYRAPEKDENIAGHWGVSVWTPDGKTTKEVLTGFGDTENQAIAEVLQKIKLHQAFWNLSDNERLKKHLENADSQGRIYDRQLLDVLKILSKDKLV